MKLYNYYSIVAIGAIVFSSIMGWLTNVFSNSIIGWFFLVGFIFGFVILGSALVCRMKEAKNDY